VNLGHRKILSVCIVAAFLFTAISCKEVDNGKKLAEQGAAAADALASYYDQLSQDTLDTLELEAFQSTIRNVRFDLESQKLIETRYESLQKRAQLARTLSSTYKAFGNLASYDASGEIKASAEQLSENLKGLPPLPGAGIDVGTIVAGAANKLAEWKQSRDLRKGNELMLATLTGLLAMYEREAAVYKAISEERGNKVANIASYLIKGKKIDASSLLEKVPKALGLSWNPGGPVSDDMLNGLAAMATVKERRLTIASMQACDDLQASLNLMKKAHEDFKSDQPPVLAEISKVIDKARTALSSISQARSNP
jgi:hypothetical protein